MGEREYAILVMSEYRRRLRMRAKTLAQQRYKEYDTKAAVMNLERKLKLLEDYLGVELIHPVLHYQKKEGEGTDARHQSKS